jgi:hypothetical protein
MKMFFLQTALFQVQEWPNVLEVYNKETGRGPFLVMNLAQRT